MNLFIFQKKEYGRLYNCTNFHVEDVPLVSRQHIAESIVTIILCAISYLLYIPCIYSISKHRAHACYKLLLYISIADCSILWLLGFVHGFLGIYGAVYCSFPTFIYFAGIAVTAIWAAESVMEISLSVNRCLAILSPATEKMLFKGWRTHLWLSAATLYAISWAWYLKPVLFTGIYFTWTFDPFIGYTTDTHHIYENFVHSVHDIANAIAVPSIYVIFFVLFTLKMRSYGQTAGESVSKMQIMLFLQIIIISSLNFAGCIIMFMANTYLSMNF
uniref:G protein-coupled receptor n=1 Tax=Ditylenchus dipsaci TaxID=166011 RepID=A0A915DHH6_9BILA